MNYKHKTIILVSIFIFLTTSVFNSSVTAYSLDPGDPQPKIDLYGYVKDAYTNAPILNARVGLDGYGYYDYTDSNGKYQFDDVEDLVYTVVVTKSGYFSTQKFSSQGMTFYIDQRFTMRFIGNIIESTIIEDVEIPNLGSTIIDVSNVSVPGYDYPVVINDVPVEIKIVNRYGTTVKTVNCDNNGDYDTGNVALPRGTAKISVRTKLNKRINEFYGDEISYGREFIPQTKTIFVSSSTTLTTDFILERDLKYHCEASKDEVSVREYKSETIGIFSSQNYECKVSSYGTPVYNPTGAHRTDFWITTEFTHEVSGTWRLKYASIWLYVTNLASQNHDFIHLNEIIYGTSSLNPGTRWEWSFKAGLGIKMPLTETITGSIDLGGCIKFGTGISSYYQTSTELDPLYQGSDRKTLGILSINYEKDAKNRKKMTTANWRIQFDNDNFRTAKECGSHLIFTVVFRFSVYRRTLGIWAVGGAIHRTETFEIGDGIDSDPNNLDCFFSLMPGESFSVV